MKKLLCALVIVVGALTYSSVLLESLPLLFAAASSIDLFRGITYLMLCGLCASVTFFLWKQGSIPFGFFLIVLGGFFLGVASRSPSPSAEMHAGLGFTLFAAGYLIVRFQARNVSIEIQDPPLNDEMRARMMERLVEAYPHMAEQSPAGSGLSLQ